MGLSSGAKRRFLDCFEPAHSGFVYRSTPGARGILVSAEDRDLLIRDFDERRGIGLALLLAVLPVTVAVTALVYALPSLRSWYPATAWLTPFGVLIAIAVWTSAIPRRLIQGRPHADDGLPKAVVERRRLNALSWFGLIVNALVSLVWTINWAMTKEASLALRLGGAMAGLLALAFVVKDVIAKVRC